MSGYGARNVINFSTRIANIGDADYYIGAPATEIRSLFLINVTVTGIMPGYAMYNIYDSLGVPLQASLKTDSVYSICNALEVLPSMVAATWEFLPVAQISTVPDWPVNGWISPMFLPDAIHSLLESTGTRIRINSADRSSVDNNVAAVCINITRDTANVPSFTILPNCQPIIDCAGDTFGLKNSRLHG